MPRAVLARLAREGKPVQRRLRVGVDGSGLLEIEIDDLDEPEARLGGGSCGQLAPGLHTRYLHFISARRAGGEEAADRCSCCCCCSAAYSASPPRYSSPYLPVSPYISLYLLLLGFATSVLGFRLGLGLGSGLG